VIGQGPGSEEVLSRYRGEGIDERRCVERCHGRDLFGIEAPPQREGQ
jgi:hypothetical protein